MLAVVTTSVGTVVAVLAPELRNAQALLDRCLAGGGLGRASFDDVLVAGAAIVLTACLLWFWVVTLTTCVHAATRLPIALGPTRWRRIVLAACGLSLLVGASPAAAGTPVPGDPQVLAGLPLPERAATPGPDAAPGPDATPRPAATPVLDVAPRVATPDPATTVSPASVGGMTTVRVGDTLWGLAQAGLGDDASPAEVDRRWREIWSANRDLIGPDPDLLHPGQHLVVPAASPPRPAIPTPTEEP